jgi:hypothetical protein
MAKAQITTKDGAKIVVEGTPEEVASLISRLEGEASASQTKRRTLPSEPKAKGKAKAKAKATPTNLIADLIDGGFFKKPKELSAIKIVLEEQGHYYPVTTLSPVVLRLVRKRQLRRIKEQKRWLYVN